MQSLVSTIIAIPLLAFTKADLVTIPTEEEEERRVVEMGRNEEWWGKEGKHLPIKNGVIVVVVEKR